MGQRSGYWFWGLVSLGLLSVVGTASIVWWQSHEKSHLARLLQASAELQSLECSLLRLLDSRPPALSSEQAWAAIGRDLQTRREGLARRLEDLGGDVAVRSLAGLDTLLPQFERDYFAAWGDGSPSDRLQARVQLAESVASLRQEMQSTQGRLNSAMTAVLTALQLESQLVLALPLLAAVCALGMIEQGVLLWQRVRRQAELEQAKHEATEALRRARDELEHRVAERTAELNVMLAQRETLVKAVEEANSLLEQRVQERTQQLAQTVAELERAMAAAEDAHQAKGDFLARMSHEIRTPLNGVLGMTELLLDGEATSQQRELLRVVKASGQHLLELIDDILDFSRIEAGKLEISVAPFRLRDLLGDLLKPLAVRAESKGVELIADIGPEVSDRLVGDAGRLRQVIVNLIGNSIKFTEKGEVVLRVRAVGRRPGRDRIPVRFEVSDTGIGIAPDRQKAIFEPFVQADGSLARKYGGTGLGLTISSRLVSLMGGGIDVTSEIGKGSTFSFTVELGYEGSSTHEYLAGNPLAGTRVLIVDDSNSSRQALAEMMRGWGMISTQETSVVGAVRALRAAAECGEPFRVVVFDGAMPPLPAGEWQREREQTRGRCEVGVVLVSLGSRRKETAAWREAATQVVCKPIHQSDLLEAIQTALGMSKLASRARERSFPETIEIEPPLRSLNILLAEDNRFNQQVAITTLEREGHRVSLAETGREALNLLEKQRFDVVLMDVQMPEMDGLEAVRLLRAREQMHGGHQPVIALTAHAMRGDEERCRGAGMDGYLTKPLDRAALRHELRRVTHASDWEQLLPSAPSQESAPATPQDEVFNPSSTLARGNGDHGLIVEIASLFRSESARILEEIDQAIGRDDLTRTTRLAHTLRGSSAFFDARRVVALAATMEQAGNLAVMKETVPELRNAVTELWSALSDVYGEVTV